MDKWKIKEGNELKYLAKMRQACQGAVGLCQKMVTLQRNYCALFYVVAIMGMT
jgi:hypothetical protein